MEPFVNNLNSTSKSNDDNNIGTVSLSKKKKLVTVSSWEHQIQKKTVNINQFLEFILTILINMGMKNKQGLCVLSRENRNKIQKKKKIVMVQQK